MKCKKFFMDDRHIGRSAVVWNAFSAAVSSFQSMVLLLVITRTGNMSDASIFVMAYAAGNLFANIGKLGTRQVQVTDLRERHSFYDYLTARRVSVTWMLLAAAGYLSAGVLKNGYSAKKTLVILLLCLFKSIEAYEDVYHGRMQQLGRLDTAGRIFGARMLVHMAGFAACYLLTRRLVFTCAVNVLASFLLFLIWNHAVLDEFMPKERGGNPSWKTVLSESFPVGACMCLYMYISNAPKFIVDTVLDDGSQACFNIIFMAVFVMSLMGGFLTTPLLKSIGERWESREISNFTSLLRRSALVVILADVCLAVLGNLAGCRVLGLIYHVDLSAYRGLMTVFCVAGGMVALQNLINMSVTAAGYQKYMVAGYGAAAAMMFCLGKQVIMQAGLYGLALFFLLVLALLDGYGALLLAAAMEGGANEGGAMGKQKKIVMIGPVYPYRGGIAHYTGLMYKALAKTSQVFMISFLLQYPRLLYKKEQKDFGNDTFKVDHTEYLIHTVNPFSWLDTAWKIRKRKPDLVIIQWWHPYFAFCYWFLRKLLKKIPVLFICHNVFPHERFFGDVFLTKHVLKGGDFFIVQSAQDEKHLLTVKQDAVYRRTVHPTYNAFKLCNLSKENARVQLHIAMDEKVLLFFGFVREYKGLKHLLRAIPEAVQRLGDIKLLVVGEFAADKKDYLNIIDKLGISRFVKIYDAYIPDREVEKFFAACDLVVLPYESATQSGIVQIAYGFEKPVLATRTGGLSEVVADGRTGYLVEPGNCHQIAQRVIQFYEKERGGVFQKEIKKEAETYSWERMAEIILGFLEN